MSKPKRISQKRKKMRPVVSEQQAQDITRLLEGFWFLQAELRRQQYELSELKHKVVFPGYQGIDLASLKN